MNTTRQSVETTLLSTILQRWKIGVIVTLVLFALLVTVIAGLKPRYAAHTLLLLPSTPFTQLTQQSAQSSTPQTDPFIIRSYAEIVLGDELCRDVIQKLNLTKNPAFQPHESRAHRLLAYIKTDLLHVKEAETRKFGQKETDEDTALILYKKRLSAFNDGRSLTLDLAFELEDPDLATKIVNNHANAYIAAQIAYRYNEANIRVQWMKKQLDASAQQLHAAEVALQTHVTPLGNSTQGADQTAELKSKKAFADAQENVYTNLLNRYNMMAAEKNYVGSDTRIVSPAIVPTHPKFPNTPLFVAISGVVSALGGCVAAWVSSLFGRSFDAEALGLDLGTSYLGTVRFPRPGSMAGAGGARRKRRAIFWEQIRTVRSSLGINVNDGAVILVTSHSSLEGKSVIAASLARAIASSGTRTLLFDADMRRPSAHKLLGLTLEQSGHRERWGGQDQPSLKAIVPVPGAPDLCLFSPWLFGADVDAMAGTRLKGLLDALKREFKVIIIDTPPIGAVADALNAAELADSTLVVVGATKKPADRLRKILANLESHGARVRGFVLTRSGNPTSPHFAHLGDALNNDRLVDVVPIPTRRAVASSVVEPTAASVPEAS